MSETAKPSTEPEETRDLSLEELLARREKAHARRAATAAALEAARSAERAATADDEAAMFAARDADNAIHTRLAERGDHMLVAPDGTVGIYRKAGYAPGWIVEHPVCGNAPR